MKTGLEELLAERMDMLKGLRIGFCCNPTAVDTDFRHAVDRLREAGVELVRLFAPEHGVRATVQDMVGLDEQTDPVTGLPVVSLYVDSAESLHPDDSVISDLDVILFDIQDIGTRFYTYQATLGFIMQAAGRVGTRVIVLDRPNPITGEHVEGNTVLPGFESFVGAFPLAIRHGMTMAELARYFQNHCGVACNVEVVLCSGWQRKQWLDQTTAPWVYPSPNMPTVDTATVYPGMCLVEGTNLSEGRGTTRPFHLIGAPWIDPQRMAGLCEASAAKAGLEGVRFRPAAFLPGFQKHAGKNCGGVELHITDRDRLNSTLLGLVTLEAAYACEPTSFAWRTETYEFVDSPIAIDLLSGSSDIREVIEGRTDLRELLKRWEPARQAFLEKRQGCLLYL
ncbi:MAG: hypothetical protein ACJAZO_002093 [Myxococcota bacterium]|jgi:uncharacterized protein YbbC (DUF1343 family)